MENRSRYDAIRHAFQGSQPSAGNAILIERMEGATETSRAAVAAALSGPQPVLCATRFGRSVPPAAPLGRPL